ncbi:MAG: o-succinylbenzoate--CoA ligase [Bacteroidetes bacterium]|nr:MAG: o-succinylbenzoate--CoA ligase [Bacteroidota bacterium]
MFLELDRQKPNKIALVDDERQITYGELILRSNELFTKLGKRGFVFILADNSIDSYTCYYMCLNNGLVPLLLSNSIDSGLLRNLYNKYEPDFIFLPSKRREELELTPIVEVGGFTLAKTAYNGTLLNPLLSMLLPTSGSTGSPKLVRHSLENLEFSAEKVGQVFHIDSNDAAIAFLPMYYTMGLSIINSHLRYGAKVVLTNRSLTERKFWEIIKEENITNLTGVPYTFEVLDKLRFSRMDLPSLKILSQGGGKLRLDLFKKFALLAEEKGIQFIATYGQTEGTARMAFLNPERNLDKLGSIGKAIPGGNLGVINSNGEEIKERNKLVEGEMIYKGKNVTLGYAEGKVDLMKGDEHHGYLKTGDIVRRDEEGYYFIIGRKKRFLKIYGLRISLDETEFLVSNEFGVECLCQGTDDKLIVIVPKIIEQKSVEQMDIRKFIENKTGIFHAAIEVNIVTEISRSNTGKILFSQTNIN